jgi:hypothetical protein
MQLPHGSHPGAQLRCLRLRGVTTRAERRTATSKPTTTSTAGTKSTTAPTAPNQAKACRRQACTAAAGRLPLAHDCQSCKTMSCCINTGGLLKLQAAMCQRR